MHMKKLVYLTIYATIYAQCGGIGIADNVNTATGLVAREIPVHAPNSPEQTVTVWVPATTAKSTSEYTTERNGATKVINLPAGNSPDASVTIWYNDQYQKTAYNVAPGK